MSFIADAVQKESYTYTALFKHCFFLFQDRPANTMVHLCE